MGGLAEGATRLLGPTKPQGGTGDIAMVGNPHNCFGILNGTKVLVVSQTGLVCLDIAMVTHVWGIN